MLRAAAAPGPRRVGAAAAGSLVGGGGTADGRLVTRTPGPGCVSAAARAIKPRADVARTLAWDRPGTGPGGRQAPRPGHSVAAGPRRPDSGGWQAPSPGGRRKHWQAVTVTVTAAPPRRGGAASEFKFKFAGPSGPGPAGGRPSGPGPPAPAGS